MIFSSTIETGGLGEYFNERDIYRDATYGVIFGIIGIAVAAIEFFSLIFRARTGTPALLGLYTHPIRFISMNVVIAVFVDPSSLPIMNVIVESCA